ncbi:OLC1v1035676C1 [Oldenlandia corymbosa var. corymbosa]|uniref:OLC1v1035676C1 n=1 Tax=Oldenlandia corymbosa var. corymbosa TaxID=529605 RepID=A0AAV1CWX3_OLDCO|nr:OLC1v1035676C1 [Oldenlandia corymbosa var. corymbosa]
MKYSLYKITKEEEDEQLAAPFRLALVGKFTKGQQKMDYLHREFQIIGFKGNYSIGSIDYRHILICFDLEKDFHRCWLKRLWTFDKHRMRLLKWTTDLNPVHESSIVPVWISLEGLPIYRFNKDYLWKLASIIGTLLQIDVPALNMSRPSVARVCVEIDLFKEHPIRIQLEVEGKSYFQSILYENMLQYCVDYKKIAHDALSCRHNMKAASLHKVVLRQPDEPKKDKQAAQPTGKQPVNNLSSTKSTGERNSASTEVAPPLKTADDTEAARTDRIIGDGTIPNVTVAKNHNPIIVQLPTSANSKGGKSSSPVIGEEESNPQSLPDAPTDAGDTHSSPSIVPRLEAIYGGKNLSSASLQGRREQLARKDDASVTGAYVLPVQITPSPMSSATNATSMPQNLVLKSNQNIPILDVENLNSNSPLLHFTPSHFEKSLKYGKQIHK